MKGCCFLCSKKYNRISRRLQRDNGMGKSVGHHQQHVIFFPNVPKREEEEQDLQEEEEVSRIEINT